MKTIRNAGVAIVLAGMGAVAPVVADPGLELERCKAQVARYYGDDSEMALVSKRQYVDGTRMKLSLRSEDSTTGYTSSRFATCWVEAENSQAGWSENAAPMVAANDGTVENAGISGF
jgi:hypothetical protein